MGEVLTVDTAKKKNPEAKEISKDDLVDLNQEFRDIKARAGSLNGDAGQLVKEAVKEQGLNRNAFKFASKCSTMETAQAQQTIRDAIKYCEYLGLWDQADMFDEKPQTEAVH